MAANTDQKARAFDLFGKIMGYCSEEKRDLGEVNDVLQIIKDKPNFAEILLSKTAAKISNVFEILCKGQYIASELIRRGKYDWVNDQITDERFPIFEHATATRKIEFVEYDHDPTSEEVLKDFTSRGLKRPTYEDGFYFGIQHKEEQRKHLIVFLHEPVQGSYGRLRVLVLDGYSGRRGLGLGWFDSRWDRGYVFAGVRE